MFKRYWWMLPAMLPVGAMVGLLFSAVVTYLTPKTYESEATIEIKPTTRQFPSEAGGPGAAGMMTPQFFATQAKLITCRNTLERVVSKLELTNRWNVDQDAAIKILRTNVKMTPIRGTDLFSVVARHTNKVDARDITEEVVVAYKGYRAEIEKRNVESALYELNKLIREQEDKVEERRKVLSTIVRVKGIIVKGDGIEFAHDTGETRDDEIRRGIEAQDYIDAKRDFETDQQVLQNMKVKQINDELASRIPSNTVEIHDFPVISNLPISPNVTLNLVSGIKNGLLSSPLLALPLIFLLGSRRKSSFPSPPQREDQDNQRDGYDP